MGIIAWIVLGLGAGLLANMAIPGKRQQGLFLTCLIGISGALLGGWAATTIFHFRGLNGVFNASTWLTAIAGAAALLLAYHLVTSQSGRSGLAGPGPASVTRTADPPDARAGAASRSAGSDDRLMPGRDTGNGSSTWPASKHND